MTRSAVTRLGFTCFTLVRFGDDRILFPARVQKSRNAMAAFATS